MTNEKLNLDQAKPIQDSQEQPQARQPIWKLIAAVVLGLGMLYLAFRGCDFQKIGHYMQQVDPLFVAAVFVIGVFSHVLRSIRWTIFLEPVAGRKVSLWHSFYAVMIGYAVNVVIPRGGEVARLVEMSRLEKLPWAGVMPTMFIDRLIDMVMLAILLGLTLTVLPESILKMLPWLVPVGIATAVGATLGLVALPFTSKILRFFTAMPFVKNNIPARIVTILEEKTLEFDKGARCLTNPVTYPMIAGLSVLMWFCYWLNFYVMIFAFHLQDKVSAKDSLIANTIGTLGVLIPTPGSAGSFHVFIQQGLELTSHLEKEQALAFATILHIIAFVTVPVLPAAICMMIESFKKKKN
ncbi:MAG: lysylphosphatidylglycerol synthase transmembrane domain-containing protein [Candidatus Melainabacteria bacterium]|nr:lysylphosphatidylglycerol synthase transmembrane domain-containing protein [Candidatus Melainabacteria bacterium]